MASIALACDLNSRADDRNTQEVVAAKLREKGHTVEILSVGANYLQSYGKSSKAKGKIGVFLINGLAPVTTADFGTGCGRYYYYDRMVLCYQAWLHKNQGCDKMTAPANEWDFNGSASFKAKWNNKSVDEVCKAFPDKLSWCCADSKESMADAILANVEKGGQTDGSSSKTTVGYDKSKPLQAHINIKYHTNKKPDVIQDIIINFTEKSHHDLAHDGITPVTINNAVRQSMCDVVELMREDQRAEGEPLDDDLRFYVHSVRLKTNGQLEDFYNSDGTDNSSCKMDIYGFGFNNGTLINPLDMQTCGKTVDSEMDELVETSKFLVHMEYAKHRKDDVINFKVDNQKEPKFLAQEGDDNNILSFTSITYKPISDLMNSSIQVFKTPREGGTYYQYTETKNSKSILNYGQMSCLSSTSDTIGEKEAYHRAVHNDSFNPEHKYSYSVVVPFAQDLQIGDLVQIKSNDKKINSIKTLQSIKWTYSPSKIPKIQTEIGLDELAPDILLKTQLRELRENAKKESTLFTGTATAVSADTNIYQWEN